MALLCKNCGAYLDHPDESHVCRNHGNRPKTNKTILCPCGQPAIKNHALCLKCIEKKQIEQANQETKRELSNPESRKRLIKFLLQRDKKSVWWKTASPEIRKEAEEYEAKYGIPAETEIQKQSGQDFSISNITLNKNGSINVKKV